mgnify:CR=1 FL=1
MSRNILINKIDVQIRDIESIDNQYDVMQFILGYVENEYELKNILRYAKAKTRQDKLENQRYK